MDFYEEHIKKWDAYIYILDGALWNEVKMSFNDNNEKIISTNKFIENMTKKSIIFICIKANDTIKIVAMCITITDLVKNYNKIKIFNYVKLNENIVEIDKLIMLDGVIIDNNNELYSKINSSNVVFKKLDKQTSQKLFKLKKQKNTQNDECTNVSTKSRKSSNTSSINVVETTDFDLTSINRYNEEKEKIPIKIYICNDFKWKIPNRTYFKKHMSKCNKCVIINNNTTELQQIFDDCVINMHNIDEKRCDDIKKCFECCIQTKTFKKSEHSHLNIYDFKEEKYLLIDWCQ